MTLCLHTGGYAATEQEVAAVPTPAATETWFPVPHQMVLERVHEDLTANGLYIRDQALALMKDGARMFGYLEVANGHNQPDYGMIVGLRNSHDQTFPVGLAVGHRVFVCDNLAFSGEVVISHKHTRRVLEKMPMLISKAMGLLTEKRHVMDERIRIYKDCPVDDRTAHDLMIRAMDQQIIAPSRLGRVLAEWREPTYEDFTPRTAWSLFNAFTHILKERQVQDLAQRTLRLHGLCDMLTGVSLGQIESRVRGEVLERTQQAQDELGEDAEVIAHGLAAVN